MTQEQAPRCPKFEELHALLQLLDPENSDGQLLPDDVDKMINALRYLDNMLSNRRGYQRKMQIKRKLMWKAAEEHGLMQEIDDAARAKLGEEFDDLGEEDIA